MTLFTLKPDKPRWLEITEQLGHGAYVAILAFGFVTPMPVWGAALLAMAYFILRELEQKDWDWRSIGRTDTFCAGLACMIFTVWFYAA